VSDGKTLVGSTDTDGTLFRGLEHDASTKTTSISGTLKYNDNSVVTDNLFADSDSIVVNKDSTSIKFELDAEIQSNLSRSLVTPMSRPSATELVAVDNTNSQKMIEIGEGLSLENGTLKVVGGSGGSVSGDYVTLDTAQTITGAKTFENLTATYSKTNSFGGTTTKEFNLNKPKIFSVKSSTETRHSNIQTDDLGGFFIGSTHSSGGDKFGLNHSVTGVSNFTGTLQYNGAEVATKNDIQTAIQDAWEASY
jgi:hypothetical protein